MKKSISVKPKMRGRPATGRDPVRGIRLSDEFMERVDAWASVQEDHPGKSEAIRRLVEIGLGTAPARGGALTSGPTARDLAAAQIDQMGDPAASSNEQVTRKRRLLKGPEEFRDVRIDRKAKP